MTQKQLSLFDFDQDAPIDALWEPRDIWLNFSEEMVVRFAEDARVEYKGSRKIDFTALSEYYSMYSNTSNGGVICIGVADSGKVEGVSSLGQDYLNKIESFHLQMCPQARPEFKRVPIKNNTDFIICVYLPCIGVLVENSKGNAYIRYGESKHKMTDEEKQDFRSTRHQRTWETTPSPLIFPDDFDDDVLIEICDGFRNREGKENWSNEEVLIDRMLIIESKGKFMPTNALTVVGAKSPRMALPGARVKVQRFKGKEQGSGENYNPIRDTYIEGNIVKILKTARDVIDPLNYDVTWLDKDGRFRTTQEYPFSAWFEALVNALVHRSYSYSGSEVAIRFFEDRLEIESPGSFMPPVNSQNVFSQRASRNANICDALRFIGFTRMSREGTRRMRRSMKEWNLPDPEFAQETLNGVSVRVTLRNDILSRERTSDIGVAQYCGADNWKLMQDHEIKIIAFAYQNKIIYVNEAANLTGRTWNTSKKDLNRLVKKGLLRFIQPRFTRDPKSHYEIINDRK